MFRSPPPPPPPKPTQLTTRRRPSILRLMTAHAHALLFLQGILPHSMRVIASGCGLPTCHQMCKHTRGRDSAGDLTAALECCAIGRSISCRQFARLWPWIMASWFPSHAASRCCRTEFTFERADATPALVSSCLIRDGSDRKKPFQHRSRPDTYQSIWLHASLKESLQDWIPPCPDELQARGCRKISPMGASKAR